MENNGLVIQKADKGNTVVLCDKDAYIDRVKELISDGTKFTNLNKLPTEWLSFVLKSEQKIRSVLYKYCESNKKHVKFVFTDKQYSSIAPTGTKPGILYGLPNIHKALVNNLPSFWCHLLNQSQLTNIPSKTPSNLHKRSLIMIVIYSCHP